MKKSRLLSLVLCIFVLVVNMHAITAKAAPLNKTEALKIANAIVNDQKAFGKKLGTGNEIIVQSFQITNLSAPENGKLLDSTATVVADCGYSWDIPVVWVDQDGNIIQVSIEIENVRTSYPIFAFYLPAGYTFVFNEAAFNIGMPDFVCKLMENTGVATIANPATGVTYITALLPGKNKVVANQPASTMTLSSDGGSESEGAADAEPDNDGKTDNGDEPHSNPSDKDSKLQWKTYNPKLTEDQKKALANDYCDDSAKENIDDTDMLAWLVSFVKDVLEPEAVNLLETKFPAYKAASENNELGNKIGFYVYYEKASDSTATETDKSGTVAGVSWDIDEDGNFEYKLGVNAYYFVEKDEKTGDYTFKGDEAYNLLDNTLVHEMMHGFMDDYTRTGMTGYQYDAENDKLTNENKEKVKFPTWFVEGMASSTDNTYQYRYDEFLESFGYDSKDKKYSSDALKESYLTNADMKLSYSDSSGDDTKSAYMSGYLANIYLGYLAAQKYDSKDAISGKESDGSLKISSEVILSGVNHILEKLHGGSTLDDIIAEISTGTDGSLYTSTDDFASKFIASSSEEVGDGNKSLDFCTTFLNYLQSNSSDKKQVNGSILMDFDDTTEHQLSKKLLSDMKDYVMNSGSDYTDSSVKSTDALESGGKSEDGIIEGKTSEETKETEENSKTGTISNDIAAKEVNGQEDAASKENSEESAMDAATESSEDNDVAATESSEDNDVAATESSDEDNDEGDDAIEESSVEGATAEASDESEEASEAVEEQNPEAIVDEGDESVCEASDAKDESAASQSVEDPEDVNVPHSIIISNAEEQNSEEDPSDNSCEEQILDAIPQDSSDEENTAGTEAVPEE